MTKFKASLSQQLKTNTNETQLLVNSFRANTGALDMSAPMTGWESKLGGLSGKERLLQLISLALSVAASPDDEAEESDPVQTDRYLQ